MSASRKAKQKSKFPLGSLLLVVTHTLPLIPTWIIALGACLFFIPFGMFTLGIGFLFPQFFLSYLLTAVIATVMVMLSVCLCIVALASRRKKIGLGIVCLLYAAAWLVVSVWTVIRFMADIPFVAIFSLGETWQDILVGMTEFEWWISVSYPFPVLAGSVFLALAWLCLAIVAFGRNKPIVGKVFGGLFGLSTAGFAISEIAALPVFASIRYLIASFISRGAFSAESPDYFLEEIGMVFLFLVLALAASAIVLMGTVIHVVGLILMGRWVVHPFRKAKVAPIAVEPVEQTADTDTEVPMPVTAEDSSLPSDEQIAAAVQ